MSKSKTPAELHASALKFFRMTKNQEGECGAEADIMSYKMVSEEFKEALLYGHAESAGFIAHLCMWGLGYPANLFNAALWIEIGAQLGDAYSLSIRRGIDPKIPGILNAQHFLTALSFTQDVTKIASPYIAQIRKNMQAHPANQPVDTDDLEHRAAAFTSAHQPPILDILMSDDDINPGAQSTQSLGYQPPHQVQAPQQQHPQYYPQPEQQPWYVPGVPFLPIMGQQQQQQFFGPSGQLLQPGYPCAGNPQQYNSQGYIPYQQMPAEQHHQTQHECHCCGCVLFHY